LAPLAIQSSSHERLWKSPHQTRLVINRPLPLNNVFFSVGDVVDCRSSGLFSTWRLDEPGLLIGVVSREVARSHHHRVDITVPSTSDTLLGSSVPYYAHPVNFKRLWAGMYINGIAAGREIGNLVVFQRCIVQVQCILMMDARLQ
jgi:hypothetical protein